MTWAAVLQRVTYGTEAREKAIAEQHWQIEQVCGTDDMSSSYSRQFNLIHRVPLHLSSLAHVKHDGFKSEQELRLTIPEQFPTSTAAQISALSALEPNVMWNSMPKTTVDVRFRCHLLRASGPNGPGSLCLSNDLIARPAASR